jgi:hypothetical protein
MADRFELEEKLLQCWAGVDNLDVLSRRIMDGPDLTKDELVNALTGIRMLEQLKYEELWAVFEGCIKNSVLK